MSLNTRRWTAADLADAAIAVGASEDDEDAAAFAAAARAAGAPVNVVDRPAFCDFQFGATYQYIVRALSFLPGNASLNTAIESNPSAPLTHIPKDTFPPSAPTNVTIASINALVSIFWPLNSEPDVAGYNIYRATSADTPPAQWLKLNPQLHKTASFRDDRVEVGKQYFYRIAAVDIYGNESLRSEVVSETVNP